MTDLRADLEQLADDMAYDVADAPARIRAVLAKHPVEPAGVSDEAVEAAAQSLYDQAMNYQALNWDGSARALAPTAQQLDVHESVKDRYRSRARATLAAALPHLQPQPVASREALSMVIWRAMPGGVTMRDSQAAADALLAAGVFRDEADVRCSCFVISDVNDNCPQHGRDS